MGSHAGEHFVTLSECFVIVRKHFVSVTAIQKNQVGRVNNPVLDGTIGEGGLLGVTDQELQERRVQVAFQDMNTHTILPFIPKCSPICRAVTL